MSDFFNNPILNSPFDTPNQHWELNVDGQPTGKIVQARRNAQYETVAVPKVASSTYQTELFRDEYDPIPIINDIRQHLKEWRRLPLEQCGVTPHTAKILHHWREYDFPNRRPFFCQVEAAEAAIWLSEVAECHSDTTKKKHSRIRQHLKSANLAANPDLFRIALKLATGAGKTTVMAMLIAWQVVNAVRTPNSSRFSKSFLIVTPGITIRDRLSVLETAHPDNYYRKFNILPSDMQQDIQKARVVITNYHAFRLRERSDMRPGTKNLSSITRSLITGRGNEVQSTETEGQMIRRVCPELMHSRNIVVINDEAHHCYKEKPAKSEEIRTIADREEKKRNRETARLWISGLEAVNRILQVRTVFDLSATPFFLSGSGYKEGTLFPWTMSDFSLLDAIESGIVKLPRVPVRDNVSINMMPRFRHLWDHIKNELPRSRSSVPNGTVVIPKDLETALGSLYSHYKKVFKAWEQNQLGMDPVFILVCINTATSKLLYDYIAGVEQSVESNHAIPGRLELFSNYDQNGNRHPKPRTLLIDSAQLESGEGLKDDFKEISTVEIETFKRELRQTKGEHAVKNLQDKDLLREVLNTVGKPGRLGSSIRCVVSVAMLSEGWDANTVTHILGVRPFSTQLLCEQVVGRALRRHNYDITDEGTFDVEYADVLGVPFDFASQETVASPKAPRRKKRIYAVSPERDHLEINFPRVDGYFYDVGNERLIANFNEESKLQLTLDMVGPTHTLNKGILGKEVELTDDRLESVRESSIAFHLAKWLLMERFRDGAHAPKLHLFDDLLRITREWLSGYFECADGTKRSHVLYQVIADDACLKIQHGIRSHQGEHRVQAVLSQTNPQGSSSLVDFETTKGDHDLWPSNERRSHVNLAVCDSGWERAFCQIADQHPRVLRYVKNHQLEFRVPYQKSFRTHTYLPDFIVVVGESNMKCVNLVVEIKGEKSDESKLKANTMKNQWIPGVNHLEKFGRWDFLELSNLQTMSNDFDDFVGIVLT